MRWKEKRKIEKFIETIAFSAIKRFYPTAVAKHTGIPVDEVFQLLLEMCESGQLKLVWEVRCPGYNCARTLVTFTTKENPPVEYFCSTCGENIEIDNSNIFPAFEVAEEFRDYIREESKKKNLLRLRVVLLTWLAPLSLLALWVSVFLQV